MSQILSNSRTLSFFVVNISITLSISIFASPKHLNAFVLSMLSGKFAGALIHYPTINIPR